MRGLTAAEWEGLRENASACCDGECVDANMPVLTHEELRTWSSLVSRGLVREWSCDGGVRHICATAEGRALLALGRAIVVGDGG
jgi:hypothetical protein